MHLRCPPSDEVVPAPPVRGVAAPPEPWEVVLTPPLSETDAKPLRVGLLWHSPNSGNLGVGALTLSDMKLIREAAAQSGRSVTFVIIGYIEGGRLYPQLAGVEALHVSRKSILNPRGCATRLRSCDLIVDIGAGDSFADIYGMKRFSFMALTKLLTLAVRRPLVLAPQTVGPFASRGAKAVSEWLIAHSAICFARDELSLQSIASARARRKVGVTSDVAFALDFERKPKAGRTRVGLNVSALLLHGGYSGKNQFGLSLDYGLFVERLITHFRSLPDVELVLVPHVIAPGTPEEDDLAACRRLAAAHGLAEPPDFADPSEAKSFISACDFLIASRMHASIAAVSSGVAAAPVAYSRKFAGLFDAIGYPHTIDARAASTEQAIEAVIALFERRDAVRSDAVAATERAKEKLSAYTKALSDLIATL